MVVSWNKLAHLACLGIFLVGCSHPKTASPPPTPQAVEAALTVALHPLAKALYACAAALPEIALFLEEIPASSLNLQDGRLGFRLGEPATGAGFSAPVGVEEIIIILNADNPLSSLSTQDIQNLFNGQIADWQELGSSSLPVHIWMYPEGDEVRSLFDSVVQLGKGTAAQAQLAPDPQAMLEAVAADTGAIGYLPSAWLAVDQNAAKVKRVQIDEKLAVALRQPILALSTSQPGPAAHSLLACLQGNPGQRAIQGLYEPWQP